MQQRFTHLHCHSDASVLDGMRPIEKTVELAKEMGFKGFALTDHGTLANWPRYYHACKEFGLKPIFGVEAYIADGERGDKKAKTHHITLLAKNRNGYQNIIKMTSEAHRTGFIRKPRIDWELMGEHSDGVICLSGCRAGLLCRPVGEGDTKKAKRNYARLLEIFGDELWYEIMFIGIDDDVTEAMVDLGRKLKARFILTNDAHYPMQEDGKYHDLLLAIGTKSKLDKEGGMRFSSHEFWMKNDYEMRKAWQSFNPNVPKAIFEEAFAAAEHVFDSVETFEVAQKPQLPVPPFGFKKSPDAALRKLAFEGLEKKGYHRSKSAIARLEEELDVIISRDFTNYFLILWEMTSFCRKAGILYGPRGSGAGSFVLFCLGVIAIDPLKNNLSFARFLNKARKEYPDVDIDFETERRHEVVEHLIAVYGEDKVAPIASFSTLQARAVIRDVGRSLDLPGHILDDAADKYDGMIGSPPFKQLAKMHPLFEGAVLRFQGQQRHMSKHAGGVVLSAKNLGDQIPVQRAGGEVLAAWSEGGIKNLSSMGFIKFDILGLSTLSIIKQTCELAGLKPRLSQFKTEDKRVAEEFANGHTTGIFQFESDGITKLLRDINVTSIDDVIAANALYRPGALDAGTAWKYAQWKKKPRRIHPLVDSVLEDTYGVITYQEQVIDLIARVTDCSPEDADLARRLIIKKPEKGDPEWEEKIKEQRKKFVVSAVRKGVEKEDAIELWKEVMTHARYSFNRAHAASYSWLAWICMYLKIYHPKEFLCALLNNGGNPRKIMKEAIRLGVKILPPHVNYSKIGFSVGKEGIYIGLEAIKGIGGKAATSIYENAPFVSADDFMARVETRVVNTRARASLLSLNSFDGFKDADSEMLEVDEDNVIKSLSMAQAKLLGFIIPSKNSPEAFVGLKKFNFVAGTTHTFGGIVTSIRSKTIKSGTMAYVTMSLPNDDEKDILFWPDVFQPNQEKLKEGNKLIIETAYSVNPKYGKQWVAKSVKTHKG